MQGDTATLHDAHLDMGGPRQSVLPPGTQVVTLVPVAGASGYSAPLGAVGVIVARLDEQSYCLRFPNGEEANVARGEIAVRTHLQRAGLQADPSPSSRDDLYDHVVYRCIVGSQAYGLNEQGSDIDRRGFYLAPAELYWSLAGAPEQLENHAM
jgi:hypothetical protein